jgi:hypothetical protein
MGDSRQLEAWVCALQCRRAASKEKVRIGLLTLLTLCRLFWIVTAKFLRSFFDKVRLENFLL